MTLKTNFCLISPHRFRNNNDSYKQNLQIIDKNDALNAPNMLRFSVKNFFKTNSPTLALSPSQVFYHKYNVDGIHLVSIECTQNISHY